MRWEKMAAFVPPHFVRILSGIPTMLDVDARLRHIEPFDDYSQVLSASNPVIDDWVGPEDTPALARAINEGMAGICTAHPDRFPGWIATLPMNNPDEAVKEIDRARTGRRRVRYPDLLECQGQARSTCLSSSRSFARMDELGKPIWLHPIRPMTHPDYATEETSQFDIWWALGVGLRDIGRDGPDRVLRRLRTPPGPQDRRPSLGCLHPPRRRPDGAKLVRTAVMIAGKERPLWKGERSLRDSFKLFYGDTAMFGGQAASQCGLAFFGAEHSVFATDYPFDKGSRDAQPQGHDRRDRVVGLQR